MTKQVAFLRAVNVGGRAIVKMSELKKSFEAAGCKDVKTFIQNGNVIFDAPDEDCAELRRRIQARLSKLLGSEAVIMFRTLREMEAIVRAAPFKDVETGDDVKLYVAFLSEKPLRKPKLPLRSPKEALDAFQIKNLEVFIVSRKKNGRYGFPNNFIEKEFGVPATTRNWTTVGKIVASSS